MRFLSINKNWIFHIWYEKWIYLLYFKYFETTWITVVKLGIIFKRNLNVYKSVFIITFLSYHWIKFSFISAIYSTSICSAIIVIFKNISDWYLFICLLYFQNVLESVKHSIVLLQIAKVCKTFFSTLMFFTIFLKILYIFLKAIS